MEIGVVGKPNVGKSTFFKSLTLSEVEVANFPFTTIKANVGVGYVRGECPCRSLETGCNPGNSSCIGGIRFIPVKMHDVAGLVPGAHEGKGLGNQFLDDLRQADVLIHVLDMSGRTDEDGEATTGHDPGKDIVFLEDEVDYWFAGIIQRNWNKIKSKVLHGAGKLEVLLWEQLSGLGITEAAIVKALKKCGLDSQSGWDAGDIRAFARILRENAKPIVLAANKIDLGGDNYERLKESHGLIPCCAEAELALREAGGQGIIKYVPGAGDFELVGEAGEKQVKALEFMREKILSVYGSTGVQECVEKAVYDVLDYIAVYPVENEHKYSDKNGNVLPDVFLMPRGSRVIDLAYRVHTDIGENFVGAVDCRSGKKVGKEHELSDCDVIKIHARS